MTKVLLEMNEKFTMLIYELDVKACGLIIGLLSMCEVMRIHMYITLVDLN